MPHGVGVQLPELRADTPRLRPSCGLNREGCFGSSRPDIAGQELAFRQADTVKRVGAPGLLAAVCQGGPDLGDCLGGVPARVGAGEVEKPPPVTPASSASSKYAIQ